MYFIVINNLDGETEQQEYTTLGDAEHFLLVTKQNNRDYKNIALIDGPTDEVLAICFNNEIFYIGEEVKIKQEWLGPHESIESNKYRLRRISDKSNTCYIESIISDMYFKPQERVGIEMIEHV